MHIFDLCDTKKVGSLTEAEFTECALGDAASLDLAGKYFLQEW